MSRISKGQKPLKIKESFFTGVGLTETELCNTSTSRKIAKKKFLCPMKMMALRLLAYLRKPWAQNWFCGWKNGSLFWWRLSQNKAKARNDVTNGTQRQLILGTWPLFPVLPWKVENPNLWELLIHCLLYYTTKRWIEIWIASPKKFFFLINVKKSTWSHCYNLKFLNLYSWNDFNVS